MARDSVGLSAARYFSHLRSEQIATHVLPSQRSSVESGDTWTGYPDLSNR